MEPCGSQQNIQEFVVCTFEENQPIIPKVVIIVQASFQIWTQLEHQKLRVIVSKRQF